MNKLKGENTDGDQYIDIVFVWCTVLPCERGTRGRVKKFVLLPVYAVGIGRNSTTRSLQIYEVDHKKLSSKITTLFNNLDGYCI